MTIPSKLNSAKLKKEIPQQSDVNLSQSIVDVYDAAIESKLKSPSKKNNPKYATKANFNSYLFCFHWQAAGERDTL